MSGSTRFVDLDKKRHDRISFDCGETELNQFLRQFAAKHMESSLSRTLVLPASQSLPDGKLPICAFYTIAPSTIRRETLSKAMAKRLPHYPVPVFLIAQLAVHKEYQGQGLGKIALVKALEHLYEINAHMRAYAIVVDCLNDEARSFYTRYGFELLCQHNGRSRLFLPMKTVAQLFA
ncbi:MAG: GNAT family N-acetyltransferase [Gammaproteobacteria bacterium]|nr:GNAT family N-acetyltransferase [Gammaproteobacteria bacterium]